jgi:hypothetical protein
MATKYWNGSEWVVPAQKVWDGTQWADVGGGAPTVTAGENYLMNLTTRMDYIRMGGSFKFNLSGSIRLKMYLVSSSDSHTRQYRIHKNGSQVAYLYAIESNWVVDLSISPGDVLEFTYTTTGGQVGIDYCGVFISEVVADSGVSVTSV